MMKMNRRTVAAALASVPVAALLPGAAWAQTPQALSSAAQPARIQVEHARGVSELPLAPRRVVVYDLASLDTMQALNLPVTALAKANFPSYMQAYADARYTKIAGGSIEVMKTIIARSLFAR